MTISEIKLALENMGRGANKALGQHFLIDQAALKTVADAAHVGPGDQVVEIGPGFGVLTQELLSRGARVLAIERDRGIAAWLRNRFASFIDDGRLVLIEGDAATGEWLHQISAGPWKFVSNLPYAITSFALRLALWAPHPPTHLSVLIQREVAERALDKKNSSLLSLMVGLAARSAKVARRVPPGAFYPPPKVDSAILAVEVLSQEERMARFEIDPVVVMEVAKRGFSHPRKKLVSNLGGGEVAQASILVDNPTIRAEALSLDEWVALAKELKNPRKKMI